MTERKNPMSAKAYLSQAYRIEQRINSKLMQAQSYRELATKTTGMITDAPRSDSHDPRQMAGVVAKIVDVEREINDDIDTLIDLKAEIAGTIECVEDTDLRLLLEFRYLCFQTWEQIANDMNYSVRWVHIVHSRALDAVDMVLRERVVGA